MHVQSFPARRALQSLLALLLGAGFFLALALTAAPAFAQSPKIGTVDLQRALGEVEDGKKARARLKKEFDGKQKTLNDRQAQVKKLNDSLEAGAAMMTEQAKREKVTQLQREMVELQQLYVEMQRDLATKEAEETRKIFNKMEKILAAIAKEKGYDLILEKRESSVLFAKESMDLTDELIKRYGK